MGCTGKGKVTSLAESPFPGQITKGILPTARAFYVEDKKAVFLNGVMGTGKTYMGLAVAYLLPEKNKRIFIQCPGHLANKWIMEARKTIPHCTCINLNGKEMGVLLADKIAPAKPKKTEIWVIGKERAKLHYQRIPQQMTIRGARCCPDCGNLLDSSEVCAECNARLRVADNRKVRRYAKAEFIKRYLPRDFFDLLLLEEVHELKGGGTAQGQAMSCLISRSKKVLSLTGTLMGGYPQPRCYGLCG